MMKNRLFAMFLMLSLLLTGCGGSTPASEKEAQPSAPVEEQEPPAVQEEPDPVPEPAPEPEPVPEPEPEPEPEPVAVAGPLDFSGYSAIPDNALPDLLYWANGAAEYEDEPSMSDLQIYEYRTSMDVVEEYIDMLCENGYTLVDQYTIGDLHSWGLVSDKVPEATEQALIFTDNPCHIAIWTNGERKFRVDIPYEFAVIDTGTRRGGGAKSLAPEGASAAAGLIRLGDGSYQTADGRLTTAVGNAAVLRDGQALTCEASLIIDGEREIESLWVENYYRNEGIYFESPEAYLMPDDLFQLSDLSRERAYDTDKDSQDAYNWGGCYFSLCHNGEWIPPTWNGKEYDALTVRVMYDEKGGDRVYYIYARFTRGEPTEVEALVAVSTDERTGALDGARYIAVGETAEIHYEWEQFGSKYHVYEWEAIEGADKVVLDGVGKNCRVTGVRPGVAVVKMTYDYTKEEPDVLTGSLRDNAHSRTEEYVFIVE